MTGMKKESDQRQHPTRWQYSERKNNAHGSTSGDTIVIEVDSETNNNYHGSIDSDTMVIEVDMGTCCSDLDAGSNIATQL